MRKSNGAKRRLSPVADLGAARAARASRTEVECRAIASLERLRVLCRQALAMGDATTLVVMSLLEELHHASSASRVAVRRCLTQADQARAEIAQMEALIESYESEPVIPKHHEMTIKFFRDSILKLQAVIAEEQRS